jgi:hypothetical protein
MKYINKVNKFFFSENPKKFLSNNINFNIDNNYYLSPIIYPLVAGICINRLLNGWNPFSNSPTEPSALKQYFSLYSAILLAAATVPFAIAYAAIIAVAHAITLIGASLVDLTCGAANLLRC